MELTRPDVAMFDLKKKIAAFTNARSLGATRRQECALMLTEEGCDREFLF